MSAVEDAMAWVHHQTPVEARVVETRIEELEEELAAKEKECQEQFRQLLGAGETFNKMNAELKALRNPEPVHKEFPFECPNCGLKANLTIDVTPR